MRKEEENLVWDYIDDRRLWGSGIYSKSHELSEIKVETEFDGVFSIANSHVEDRKLTLISLYGFMEESGPTKGYSIPNLHRILSDLTCIFYNKTGETGDIILGGDLDASIQFDSKQGNNSHRIFFDRLDDFGLFDCFKLSNKEFPVQTLRHNRSDVKWQNDYVFIGKRLSKKLARCEVIDNEKVRKFSDHNPILIELDL